VRRNRALATRSEGITFEIVIPPLFFSSSLYALGASGLSGFPSRILSPLPRIAAPDFFLPPPPRKRAATRHDEMAGIYDFNYCDNN
jgi:hypothetical protein